VQEQNLGKMPEFSFIFYSSLREYVLITVCPGIIGKSLLIWLLYFIVFIKISEFSRSSKNIRKISEKRGNSISFLCEPIKYDYYSRTDPGIPPLKK